MIKRESKIQKVMFITNPYKLAYGQLRKPFYSNSPVAFLWLSAYLKSRNIESKILDAYTLALPLDEIMSEIDDYQPDMIGLSVFTIAIYDNLFLAEKIKERFPHIVIVMGGHHITFSYDESLTHGFVDFCVIGEGEVTLHELIESLNQDDDLHKIKGLAWNDNGRIVKTPGRELRQNFGEMPILPYEQVIDINYHPWCFSNHKKDKYMSTISSKGCPMGCIFCNIVKTEGSTFRCFSAERTLEEIEHLYYKFGVNQIEFLDPIFTLKNKRVKEICSLLLERNIKIEWACASSIRAGDDSEMLGLMKQSGCKMIFYGVECGNPEMLKKIKNLTPETVKRVVDMTEKAGIDAHISFVLGLPGETKETMNETVDFAIKLKPTTVSFSVAIPFKGTVLYETYKEKLITTDYRKYESSAVFQVPEYSPKYLEDMLVRAHRRFYFRPRNLLNKIRSIATWHDVTFRVKIAFSLLLGKLGYKVE